MKTVSDIYESRRNEFGNEITLTINGRSYDVSDWIADLAFARDDIKDNVHYKRPVQQELLDNACNRLYNIVNDNWKDEYSN